MTYFVYLKQEGEGCDYTIGCGNTLRKLQSTSPEEAVEEVKNMIQEEYTGELELSEAIILSNPVKVDVKSIYSDMNKRKEEEKSKRQHIKDMEEFERLKKRLGK